MKPEYSFRDDLSTFEALLRIVERLRGPEGWPWDLEQTHQSLKRNLLEECYEVLEAIDSSQPEKLAEEMGDLLVQLAFHTDIASKNDEFTWDNVFLQVNNKYYFIFSTKYLIIIDCCCLLFFSLYSLT